VFVPGYDLVVHEQSRLKFFPEAGLGHRGVFIPSGGTAVKGAAWVPEIIRRIHEQNAGVFFVISGLVWGVQKTELDYLRSRGIQIYTPGHLSHSDNLNLTLGCDLAVSPVLLENFSCALLECQALGLPVVTFDIGGNREVVQDGQTGVIVEFPDIDKLVFESLSLLNNPTRLQHMSQAAAVRVRAEFSAEIVLEKYRQLFTQLLGSKR
jgi:glycosyltransferase involved in cell wall biosynthesis